jgi:hypothetical protein
VDAVTVDGLRGLDPQLSATIVTLAVTIESRVSADEPRDHLAATTCIDTIERLAESH